LNTARTTPTDVLARGARSDVSYPQLFADPEEFRGQVINLRGRLKRVRAMPAPSFIREDISTIYECGIFDARRYGDHPLIAAITELPADVEVSDDMEIPVEIDGYFFKIWRYRAGDAWRDAPLLIGRTLRVEPGAALQKSADTSTTFSKDLVIGSLLLFGITIGAISALSWWYRRGDSRIRERIAAKRGVDDLI
jgi:hypothetical protein